MAARHREHEQQHQQHEQQHEDDEQDVHDDDDDLGHPRELWSGALNTLRNK